MNTPVELEAEPHLLAVVDEQRDAELVLGGDRAGAGEVALEVDREVLAEQVNVTGLEP
jgi:hypothetical protein